MGQADSAILCNMYHFILKLNFIVYVKMIRTSARQPQKLYESCIQPNTLCNGLLLMSMSELQLIWEVRMKHSHPLKTWKEKENPLNLTVRPAIDKSKVKKKKKSNPLSKFKGFLLWLFPDLLHLTLVIYIQ